MNFEFSTEQEQLRSSLRGFLAARNPFGARTSMSRSGVGFNMPLWRAFADELGILGVGIPQNVGGTGGDAVDTMIIMEELGANLTVEPFLETVVICGRLLAASGGREADLERIVSADSVFAFAWAEPSSRFGLVPVSTRAEKDSEGWVLSGEKSVVTGAPWATDLIVSARTAGAEQGATGVSLFHVDPASPGITMSAYPTIDGKRAADIHFNLVRLTSNALIGEAGNALPLIEEVADTAIAALAAEAVGVMRKLVQDTIDYTQQRRQFGQPISRFQALQHRMVDMSMQHEFATSAAYLASLSIDAEPLARAKAASTAKVSINNALRFVAQNAVQLHGGMGMADETSVSHYFRRATAIETEFGSVDHHLARLVALEKAGRESRQCEPAGNSD